MELHPIPENIMQVEFQLFGDFTIREFSYIAAGGVIAFIVYSLNPPFLLKWPFILLFALGGIALAKFKINDRGLDTYLSNFLIAMMSTQKMIWRKGTVKSILDDLDDFKIEVRAGSVASANYEFEQISFVKSLQIGDINLDDMYEKDQSVAALIREIYAKKEETPGVIIKKKSAPKVKQKGVDKVRKAYIKEEEEEIPEIKKVKNKGSILDDVDSSSPKEAGIKEASDMLSKFSAGSGFQNNKNNPFKFVEGSAKLVKKKNVITGFVKSDNGSLLDNVVVVIREKNTNRNVRSMVTNSLGYFSYTTSLKNGAYIIKIYKEGHSFEDIEIELDGNMIEPIIIQEK